MIQRWVITTNEGRVFYVYATTKDEARAQYMRDAVKDKLPKVFRADLDRQRNDRVKVIDERKAPGA